MKRILSMKHWQLFWISTLALFLSNFTVTDNEAATLICNLVGSLIILSLPFLLGYSLFFYLESQIDLNYNLFVINSFIAFGSFLFVSIIFGKEGVKFNGIYAVPGFYIFYAFAHLFAFPAKVLRSLEKGREAKLSEYIGYFFLIVFFPIGIWFLQPRINRIVEDR